MKNKSKINKKFYLEMKLKGKYLCWRRENLRYI